MNDIEPQQVSMKYLLRNQIAKCSYPKFTSLESLMEIKEIKNDTETKNKDGN